MLCNGTLDRGGWTVDVVLSQREKGDPTVSEENTFPESVQARIPWSVPKGRAGRLTPDQRESERETEEYNEVVTERS